jgi:hypothetical protein
MFQPVLMNALDRSTRYLYKVGKFSKIFRQIRTFTPIFASNALKGGNFDALRKRFEITGIYWLRRWLSILVMRNITCYNPPS